MKYHLLHIGFDDTDSPQGMCTTFLAHKIVSMLKKEKTKFVDYPKLIRFNPNIPWKTRGNGAVGLTIKTPHPLRVKNKIISLVKKYSDVDNGANPGLVFFEGNKIPKEFFEFSSLALWRLINRSKAKQFAKSHNLDFFYMGNGQGLIGAIGVLGYRFDDHTLELLSYRKKSHIGSKRQLSKQSVKQMQDMTYPYTFNSYDATKDKVLITPHGPDPVFYGIRGEDPQTLLKACKLIKTAEPLYGYLLFKSNQGTGAHLQNSLDVNDLRAYDSGFISGIVSSKPQVSFGGHVFFNLEVQGVMVPCAIYKKTGLGKIATQLIAGDHIQVGGGVRKSSSNHPRTLNVEYIRILKLAKQYSAVNPTCSACNKKMKSKGVGQGFECVKCGKKTHQKQEIEISRTLHKKTYIPVVLAHRHLTRPLHRKSNNKKSTFSDKIPWFKTFEN